MPAVFLSLVVTTKMSPDLAKCPQADECGKWDYNIDAYEWSEKRPCVPQLGVLFCQFLSGASIGRKALGLYFRIREFCWLMRQWPCHRLLTLFPFSVQRKNIPELFSGFKITAVPFPKSWSLVLLFHSFWLKLWLRTTVPRVAVIL